MDIDTIPTSLLAVISREEAREQGLKRYFTGTPCSNGHVVERFVSNKHCYECTLMHNQKSRVKPDQIEKMKEWKRKNKDKIYEQEKARRQTPEGRIKAYLYAKKHKEKYPDEVKARLVSWRARNKDHVRAYERQRDLERKSYKYTPEGIAAALARTRNRRAMIKAIGGTHTKEDIQDIHRLQKGKCAICRKKLGSSFHVDHIVPIAKGGSNDRSNLQLAHPICNQQKNRKDPIEHMRSLGYLL